MEHASHPDIINRLKRADGHLRRIIAMIEEGRPCVEVAQQMQAVESAVTKAKQVYIRDHIDHCLEGTAKGRGARELVREFQEIARYL
ncbi:MAG: metal-sensing transcriptional repressor [Proteobacteria bacterium]|jgi:uncharacterized protein|nr:metal-sensing transcriptional repressor [Pseudomonadota bacterium]MDA1072919.1 metal-sensing transcriptional repressor [Pseudomonadota bacterium]